MARIGVAILIEDLQRKGGRGQRQAEPGDDAAAPVEQPGEENDGGDQSACYQHLRAAKPENVAPHLPQARGLQLQADDEQQEHDAQFRKTEDLFAVADLVQEWADDDAGRQIAKDGAEPELLEDRRCDDSATEQKQSL